MITENKPTKSIAEDALLKLSLDQNITPPKRRKTWNCKEYTYYVYIDHSQER